MALERRSRKCRLRDGGQSSRVAPRFCTERERTLAGAVPFHSAGAYCGQPDTARVRGKLACFATSRDSASAVALACRSRKCRLCAGGHSSYVPPRSCTERERPSAGAVSFHSAAAYRSQPGAAHARGELASFATSRDSASGVAPACRSRKGWLHVGAHSSHVALRSFTEGERPLADAVPFRSTAGDRVQRDTALARDKSAWFPTSRETACAVALMRRSRECRLRDGGQRLHIAPRSCSKERGLPLMQCTS